MEQHDITRVELLAYLENALASDAMAAVQARLIHDDALAAELQRLREQEAGLRDLGGALRDVVPSISVREQVMHRIRAQQAASEDSLEAELTALGGDLRAQTPSTDVVSSVMERLPEARRATDTQRLEQALVAVGDEIRRRAPRVEVADQVAADVAAEKSPNISSLAAYNKRKALRRRESPLSWRAVAAAAACLAVGLTVLMSQILQPTATDRLNIARQEQGAPTMNQRRDVSRPDSQDGGAPLPFKQVASNEAITLLSNMMRPTTEEDGSDDPHAHGSSQELSIEAILAARREALGGKSESLALLARWGALDPDEVRRLLEQGHISTAELAGLSRFLPEEEAIALLEQAIIQSPDDPALRYALARQLMEDPARHGQALEHLAMLKELAPGNSLPYYMDAQLLLAQGDYAGALQMLEYAASFGAGSAFALDGAQYHAAALLAAGLPADVAQMLAAFNAGGNEYASVTQLSYDLLSYGAYFESLGDYETALAIYKSVNRLGLQISQGALFSNEQLAGLDAQMAAIEAVNALSQVLNDPAILSTVDGAYDLFMEGLNVFLDNTRVIENMLGDSDITAVLRVIQRILMWGDLRYSR